MAHKTKLLRAPPALSLLPCVNLGGMLLILSLIAIKALKLCNPHSCYRNVLLFHCCLSSHVQLTLLPSLEKSVLPDVTGLSFALQELYGVVAMTPVSSVGEYLTSGYFRFVKVQSDFRELLFVINVTELNIRAVTMR